MPTPTRATEQFIGMSRNPHFADLTIREFGVLDAPTAITAPALRAPLNEEQPPMTLTLTESDQRQPLADLSDHTLEGFRSRAAEARPDQHLLPRRPRRAALRSATSPPPCRPSSAAGARPGRAGRRQRRLARYAPATALAMCMHHYWIGIATELERAGDTSLRWILDAAVDGEVFAAGHAEAGNDIPVLLSTCRPSGSRAATG